MASTPAGVRSAAHASVVARPVRPKPDRGPFDLFGDVHGCIDEVRALLELLGYSLDGDVIRHPGGRRVVFLGDLVDRGPDTPGVLRMVMASDAAGTALAVVGNHDDKLRRALIGRPVKVTQGLAESLAQLEGASKTFCAAIVRYVETMPSYLILDGGALLAAHAGLPRRFHGREDKRTRQVAMFGLTTGRTDEDGLPERLTWAADYAGPPAVAYGHTPVIEPTWSNDTIDIDTGCVFGYRLSALRWPEREVVWVPARRVYQQKSGPFRLVGPGGAKVDAVASAVMDGEGEPDGADAG